MLDWVGRLSRPGTLRFFSFGNRESRTRALVTRAARVQYRLARLLAWKRGDLPSARRTTQCAVDLFRRAERVEERLVATNLLGWIDGLNGSLANQERVARTVLQEADHASNHLVAMLALHSLGCVELQRGNFAHAEAAIRRSLALAVTAQQPRYVDSNVEILRVLRALEGRHEPGTERNPHDVDTQLLKRPSSCPGPLIHWLAGDFSLALAALNAARPTEAPRHRSCDWDIAFGALSAAELGRLDDAENILSSASTIHRSRDYVLFNNLYIWASAYLHWRAGAEGKASRWMQDASHRLLSMGALPLAAFVLVDLAEIAQQVGDNDLLGRVAIQLGTIANYLDRPLYRGLASVGSARAFLGSGDVVHGRLLAQRGVGMLEGDNTAFLARALDVLSQASIADDRQAAISSLQRAATQHVRTGATWRARKAIDALRRLGHPGRRAAITLGPRSLSRRELDVARLASQGLTAQEISRQLFITARTVETHLANAYAKLGLRSKLELMSRAQELALANELPELS